MGQACAKDNQTSQRSFSLDGSVNKSDKLKHNKIRGNDHFDSHQPYKLLASEEFIFDNQFNRRHEKLKSLGKHTMPKRRDNSDLDMSL